MESAQVVLQSLSQATISKVISQAMSNWSNSLNCDVIHYLRRDFATSSAAASSLTVGIVDMNQISRESPLKPTIHKALSEGSRMASSSGVNFQFPSSPDTDFKHSSGRPKHCFKSLKVSTQSAWACASCHRFCIWFCGDLNPNQFLAWGLDGPTS